MAAAPKKSSSKTPPWKKPSPKGSKGAGSKLTPAKKAAAKKRAEAAGRRYPNLVDNMWAVKHASK